MDPSSCLDSGTPINFQDSWKFSQRDVVLVGLVDALVPLALSMSQKLELPVLAKVAEALTPGYSGSKVEVPVLLGGELRRITLVALPMTANRHVTRSRPDILRKHLSGKIEKMDVIIAVNDEADVFPLGAAVGRCANVFTMKTKKTSERSETRVAFHRLHNSSIAGENLQKLENLVCGIRIAQMMVDMPPDLMNPTSMKEFCVAQASALPGVVWNCITGSELKAQGYGGIYNVGRAATNDPCLLVLTHTPPGSSCIPGVALVGKGISFDTGGIALKGREGMCGMKADMGGAAGLFGAFVAVVKNGGIGRPLHCVLCIAENAIGPNALLHDEVITMYSGVTVEVNNTDAEGRLVLGDGVVHAAKNLNADTIIDMATLTGASMVSTGMNHGGVCCNDAPTEACMIAAGNASGDMTFPMIFAPEMLMHEFDSPIADMKNSVKTRTNAQSSCAGMFIYRQLMNVDFQGKWCHIDMAGPVSSGDIATGYGVALLQKFFDLGLAMSA